MNTPEQTHKVGTFFSFIEHEGEPAILLQLVETKYHEFQLIACFSGNRWINSVYKQDQKGKLVSRNFITKDLLGTEIFNEFRPLTLKEVANWINSEEE